MAQGALAGPLSPLELAPAFTDVLGHLALTPAMSAKWRDSAINQSIRAFDADAAPLTDKEDTASPIPLGACLPFGLYAP